MGFSKNIGLFKPKAKDKYIGNIDNIIYRSSLEEYFFRFFDLNNSVLQWNSEGVVVPYISPLDNRQHRYFVDNWIKIKTKKGKIKEFLIEIKPYSEISPPTLPKHGRITTGYTNAQRAYAINYAKWESARKYVTSMGINGFIFLTERDK